MHLVTKEEILKKEMAQDAALPAVEPRAPESAAKASLDVVSQMRANLNQLEELQERLGFVMGEVREVIRKKSASRR